MLLLPSVLARDEAAKFDLSIWERLNQLGLFHTDRSHPAICSALYGLAKASLDLPYCSGVAAHLAIGLDLVERFANDEQKEKYLPDLLSSRRISAICNSEEGSGSDLRLMKSKARSSGGDLVLLDASKPCSTNLGMAGLVLLSCWGESQDLRVFLLEESDVEQSFIQDKLASFRTGAVGSLKVNALEISKKEREVPHGLVALRHCFHIERFYLGVLVAGVLAGLETVVTPPAIGKESTQQRQYLQGKLVGLRAARIKLEALLTSIYEISDQGTDWEKAAGELSVLKMFINLEAAVGVEMAFETIGFAGIYSTNHVHRNLRDFQALTFFGGTTELQKLQVYQELSKSARALQKIKNAA